MAKKKKNGGEILMFAINAPKGCAQVIQNGNIYLLNCSGSGPQDSNGNLPNKVFIKWYMGTGAVPTNPPNGTPDMGLFNNQWSAQLNMAISASDLKKDFTLAAWYAYGMMSQIRQLEISVFQPQTESCRLVGKKPKAKAKKKSKKS